MLKREIVEDLAILLRGFFATPVISSLGRLGVLNSMRTSSSFTATDFSNIPNVKLLADTFRYLARIGLIERVDGSNQEYKCTELGSEVFRRANSFYVPHSYFEYMYKYHEMIQSEYSDIHPEVERLENVIGSGITHLRYFPPAISFLKRKVEFDVLVDIGCGDGHFLSAYLKEVPDKKIIGIDLSEISTERTKENLLKEYPQLDLTTFCVDASDVEMWSKEVKKVSGNGKIAIAMWFLIQEISKSNPQIIIDFLSAVKKKFPDASIVVGEMVRQSEHILLKNSHRSLLPEYLFFHEMSNQGVLSWPEYKEILVASGYELVVEKLFDEVSDEDLSIIPSTFVWCLVPKKGVTNE